MIAAPPQRSYSPVSQARCPSPLSFSLLSAERRAAAQDQTVPISPTLSPLEQRSKKDHPQLDVVSSSTVTTRHSPSPALVPECGERVFSGSPLLKQILTVGRKRQRDASPDTPSKGTPSPIATTSKRFCKHCSNVYSETSTSLVVLSRNSKKVTPLKRATSVEQVVPNQSPVPAPVGDAMGSQSKVHQDIKSAGIKMFELFNGDDIFAHHGE